MSTSRSVVLLLLLILAPTISSAGFKEQRLAVIPVGHTLDRANIVFTPDGSKVAFAAQLGVKFRVVFGDRVGKLYGVVRHISISPDGRSVAHNGTPDPQREAEYRVVNDIETGPFQQVCNPIFSPDSSMSAFEVKNADKWRHAISGVDSNRIAAQTGPADMHWMRPVFSPNGRFIVSIQRHYEAKKAVRLVSTAEMREVRRREYDAITGNVYSADGLRTAYVARKSGEAFVVTSSFAGGDEREGARFDRIIQIAISADGGHVAYGAERSENRFLVMDERESPAPFFYGPPPVFSRDGRSVAYTAIRGGKPFIVAAGKESSQYEEVSIPALNDDGSVVAFGGLKEGKWRVIVNGNEGPVSYDLIDNLQFAPDDRHVAFRALKGVKYSMVIVDLQSNVVREGPLFEGIWVPSFDDAGRLGYGALAGREIWWKVLDVD